MPDYPEKYQGIDFVPPQGVRDELRKGIEAVEDGKGGDGLEDVTVREARAMARGEAITVNKARKAIAWWKRNDRFLESERGSDAWVAAKLWGGQAGRDWFEQIATKMERADNRDEVQNATADLVHLDFYEAPVEKGWRNAFRYGEVRHPVKNFKVDADFCESVVRSFEYLKTRYDYYPPIAVEHKFEVELEALADLPPLMYEGEEVPLETILNRQGEISEGLTWGIIADVRHRQGEGLDVKPRYVPAAMALEQMGLLTYVSPSFFPEWTDPHTGVKLRYVLREFTHCGIPHQKNLDTPVRDVYALSACSLSESGFRPGIETEEEIDMEEILEALGKLGERMDGMEAKFMEYMGDKAEMADDEEEAEMMADEEKADMADASDSKRIDELELELAATKAEMAEKEVAAEIVTDLGCDAELAKRLAPIKLHNAETYDAIKEWAGQAGNAATTTERPMRGRVDNGENKPAGGAAKVVMQLAEKAASEGIERADFSNWAMQQAGQFGFSGKDIAQAITPELVTPAYSVTRH